MSLANSNAAREERRLNPIIAITDPDDPRIAAYRHIREADLVGREGCFIAEGEVVLRMLLTGSRHPAQSVLIADKRIERLAPLLAQAPADAPIYSASQTVMDAIVGFPIHRGILALGRKTPEPSPEALLAGLPPEALVLALFGIANHDNMGGLFRNAAAFGVGAVLLDGACCDPFYRKAIRVSVGGVLAVPFARLAPHADPLALLRSHDLTPIALSPRGQTRLIDLEPPSRAALLLGAEGPGLSEALIAASRSVSLPMSAGFDSLNVATTSGIALHHLAFARRASATAG
ncbi:MAG: RNA methyltransferase [Caulobacteraceae bacterium]|nr:RNA methyltransferase [Caulobacteraceae bacterium]